MRVTWKDDLRPDPDHCPPGCEEAAFDPELILERSGTVVGQTRTFFSGWVFLVRCEDGKLREVSADRCEVLE